jgi:hypothetical protein
MLKHTAVAAALAAAAFTTITASAQDTKVA